MNKVGKMNLLSTVFC